MTDLTGTGQIVVARPIRPRVPGEQSIISKFIGKVRQALSNGAQWAGAAGLTPGWTDPRWWSDDPDDWPVVATEADALGLPPFGRGVDLIASGIAGVDLAAYRHDKAAGIDVRLEPQPSLLRDPVVYSTPWNYRYGVVNDLVLYGNHVAFMTAPDATGWPTALEPVDITTVDLGVSEEGYLAWNVAGEFYPYGSLFHISAGNRSGYILGRGAIQQYRDALGGVVETDRHSRGYFRRGGLPTAVIQVQDPDLGQKQAQDIKDRYMATIGRGRSREPLVIPGTYTFTPVVSDAEKQQLVEARTWDAQLVAMILGVPAAKLNLPGPSMTYSNIEMEDIAFVRDTVNRWAQPIEAAVTKWLLPAGQQAKHEWMDRLRTDSKTRAEVFETELRAGIRTVEEVRQIMNLPPLPKPEPAPVPPALEQGQEATGAPESDEQPTEVDQP